MISVVVPFFNSERFLAACIESLQAQEGVEQPYEIILIDNGSTDDSPAIAGGYDGIEVLSEAKTGAYAARNTGIRAASAPLIALTDADCVVDSSWLRAMVRGMNDPSAAILVGYCAYPPHASPALKLLAAYENAKAEYVLGRCPPAYHFAYANNMAVRRWVFDELGPFEEWRRAADSELVHRLAARRPDQRTAFHPAMRVTHLEFVRARDRTRRLSLYTRTNTQITTFRELEARRRLGMFWLLVRRLARG
jgi:glycosyltransferase involved in cell wall biosynthesis